MVRKYNVWALQLKVFSSVLASIILGLGLNAFAYDLPVIIKFEIKDDLDARKRELLNTALSEVSDLLPAKFKSGLPKGIELRFDKLSDHDSIPKDLCLLDEKQKIKGKKEFVYGEYDGRKKILVLNQALLRELLLGREKSVKINCQHKTMYDQVLATILHELAHAYDFNNANPSGSNEFIFKAGFKKGLLKVKNKNVEAMRSADTYELSSVVEAYAVSMEYFLMDPEFACRKPVLFEYFKTSFQIDPFPLRDCQVGRHVLVSSSSGETSSMTLDPKRVYRIDYLMASSGKDLSSGFGHAMFRIVMCAPERFDTLSNRLIKATPFGPQCIEDRLFHLVVSYRANVEDATLNYLKGLYGGYPSMLFILHFSDVLDEYNRDELRDIVSYPLQFSPKDKVDFINRVLEEHWNYRGSYKFITNNCAVESYDLLKGALDQTKLDSLHSFTPRGVLNDLEQLGFLQSGSTQKEIFKAKTESLKMAFSNAYGGSSLDSKRSKNSLQHFIAESQSRDRLLSFNLFYENREKRAPGDFHTAISLQKKDVIKASSFSVLEQQILRYKTAELRKKAVDLFMKLDPKNLELLMDQKQSLPSLSGYGIPLSAEVVLPQKNTALMNEKIEKVESLLKKHFPNEINQIEAIQLSIFDFNQKSLKLRKIYRDSLDQYIRQVITNLTFQESSRELLLSSLHSDLDLAKVRSLLDRELVSEKEILDVKLRVIIAELLS